MHFQGNIAGSAAGINPLNTLLGAQVIRDRQHFVAPQSQLRHHQIPQGNHFPRFSRIARDRSGVGLTSFKPTVTG